MSSEGGLLTSEELQSINTTWALVAKDLKGNGVQFFIHFFTGYPEYQKVFRGFANIPLEQLATNKRLMAHGFTVFSSIAGLVDNLGDPEVLDELLLNVGRSHGKRGLKPGDFQNLKKSLLEFMVKALGSELTPVGAGAWEKVLNYIMTKISEGLTSEA